MGKRNNISQQWVWDKLHAYLKKHNLKNTSSRNQIMDIFFERDSPGHVSVEYIFQALSQKGYRTGLATIYRALNLLVDAHILEQHNFHNKNAVYELKYPGTHHDHLVCLDCGLIKEFEDEDIEQRQESIAENLGFQLASHRHELFGRCMRKKCPSKTS